MIFEFDPAQGGKHGWFKCTLCDQRFYTPYGVPVHRKGCLSKDDFATCKYTFGPEEVEIIMLKHEQSGDKESCGGIRELTYGVLEEMFPQLLSKAA